MDPLKLEVLNSLAGVRTGDGKVDQVVADVKNYIIGFLKRLDEGYAGIDAKKGRYTPDGLNHERKKLGEKIKVELDELVKEANYHDELLTLRERLSVPQNESELQAVTRTMREIEVRGLMIQVAKDPLVFESMFGESIREGHPVVISAIENSPLPMPVLPEILKQGQQKRADRLNPLASGRLKSVEIGQATIDALVNEVNQVLGNSSDMEISGA